MKKEYIIKIDAAELDSFNKIFNDNNLIHSQSTLVDDVPIVFGSFIISKINAFLGNSLEHPLTLIRSSNISFLKPIHCGDIVSVVIDYEFISSGIYQVYINCKVKDRTVIISKYLIKTHE